MADTDKKAVSAANKEAEKAAKKAKQERIKASKPKKEGSAASRAGKSIKKFWKDFTGTVKKIVWPGAKQVLKSSLVVLASIVVVGLIIFGFDRGLTALFDQTTKLVQSAGEASVTTTAANEENDEAERTTAAEEASEAEDTSEAEGESEAEEASETEADAEEEE